MSSPKLDCSGVLKKINCIEKMQPVDPRYHPVYGVHAYWAKKFPNVITTCIEAFTAQKEIVLDPFAGTGVTIIEALTAKRRAIGVDINPLSVFLMETALFPVSNEHLNQFMKDFDSFKEDLWGNDSWQYIKELYQTDCPACGRRNTAIVLEARYDSVNRSKNLRECSWKLKAIKSKCSKCDSETWRVLRDTTVKEIYEEKKSLAKRIKLFRVDDLDKDEDRLRTLESEKPRGEFPKWKLCENTRINVHKGMTIEDLYTRRNLLVLSALKKEIESHQSFSKELLRLAFSCSLHLARMTDYKRASPQNFYVPRRDMTELNYWLAFENRVSEVITAKRYIWDNIWKPLDVPSEGKWNAETLSDLNDTPVMVKAGDACKLVEIVGGEGVVDYIHTDPPYADQVPYLEISVPWIAWLDLATEEEWKKLLEDEIILSDSKERVTRYRQSQKGLQDYKTKFMLSLSEMKRVLKRNRWLSVWYCCTNEEYWRPLTDSLNNLGFERKKSQIVSRAVPTFKQVITVAQKPLSQVREEEILRHYLYTGKAVPVNKVPLDEALELFVESALEEISTRGEATTGEITVKFYVNCIDKYDNPPPDYDYFNVLAMDKRFEVVLWKDKIGKKEVEYQRWRLRGKGQQKLGD
jgi:hypothetical protein